MVIAGQFHNLVSKNPAYLSLLDLRPGFELSLHCEGKHGNLTGGTAPILVELFIIDEMSDGFVADRSPYPGVLERLVGCGLRWLESLY